MDCIFPASCVFVCSLFNYADSITDDTSSNDEISIPVLELWQFEYGGEVQTTDSDGRP
jgi:hypothetical protein